MRDPDAQALARRIVRAIDGSSANMARIDTPDHHEIFAIQSQLQHDGMRFNEAWHEAKAVWLERLLGGLLTAAQDSLRLVEGLVRCGRADGDDEALADRLSAAIAQVRDVARAERAGERITEDLD